MKKIAAVLMISAFALNAEAQKVYVQGGANLANITTSEEGHTEDNNTLTSFNAGLMVRLGRTGPVAFETGLLFTGKGSRSESGFTIGGNEYYVRSRFNPYYLEVPLNLVVKIPAGTGAGLFVHAGPYAAIGIAGKAEVETNVPPVSGNYTRNIEFSNDDPFTSSQEDAAYNKLKRFDYGVNIGAGIDLKKLMIKFNYGLGMAKINSTSADNNSDDKNKFRTFSLSLGIPLGL